MSSSEEFVKLCICPGCQKIFCLPLVLPCGHGICRNCTVKTHRCACPTCDETYEPGNLPINDLMVSILQILKYPIDTYIVKKENIHHVKEESEDDSEEDDSEEDDDKEARPHSAFPCIPSPGTREVMDYDVFNYYTDDEQYECNDGWEKWEHLSVEEWDYRRAVAEDDIDKVKAWVEMGYDALCTDPHSNTTSIHTAAGYNAIHVLTYLVDQIKNIEMKDDENKTPLHWAARSGALETTRFLLSRGAKTNLQEIHGQSPLEMAKFSNECNENCHLHFSRFSQVIKELEKSKKNKRNKRNA